MGWLVVTIAAALVAIAALVLALILRRNAIWERLRRDLGASRIVAGERTVLYLGLKSKGGRQWRGNGALAATSDEIRFRGWVLLREVRIPRRDVVDVSTTTAHAGKTLAMPLLAITFRDADGRVDVAAWATRDLDAWLAALGGRRR